VATTKWKPAGDTGGDRLSFQKSITPEQREFVWQSYMLIFNDVLKSAVECKANHVPYWPSSPSANYEEDPDNQQNGDMHYWMVWHMLAPIATYNEITPRFMSEYGFQSFPEMRTIRSFAEPDDLKIDSVTMLAHQKNTGGNDRIHTYMLREYREPKDFAAFVYLSQVQQAEAIKTCAEHLRRSRPRTMGSLYWQLNDCWPVASWSSIDYFGRWKALHYYARRFYDDLLISPYRHDGVIDTYVVSDRLAATRARIRTRLMEFSGNCLSDASKDLEVAPASSKLIESLNEQKLIGKSDPKNVFAIFDLVVEGKTVSTNIVFFAPARDLKLPSPVIDHSFSQRGQATILTLKSNVLARQVFLSFGDLEARPSDNYFDLIPGQPVEIKVDSKAKLADLQHSLSVTSLIDAYPSQ
jgi:beta-mannosidase